MIKNHIFKTILLASATGYIFYNSSLAESIDPAPSPQNKSSIDQKRDHHHKSKANQLSAKKKLSVGIWTLESAIETALQNYPEISGYIAAKRAAEKRIDAAKGGYLPTLDLRTTGGYEYTRDKLSNNKLNGGVNGTVARADHYEPSISLEQPLFDGFETVSQVDKAEKEHHQANLKINESKILIAYKVAEQYIALRRFQRLLKLAHENVDIHNQIAGKVEKLVKAGKLTIIEREQVSSRLADAQSAVADIEGDVENALANFVELVGEHPAALAKVSVPFDLLPTTLDQALQMARKNNKSIILARATVDVAKSNVDVTKSTFYPKVGINVDATRRFNVSAKDGNENNLTALLVVRWNLFNGYRDVAKKGEYQERVIQAYHDMKKEILSIEKEIRVSWGELRSTARQAKSLRSAVTAKKQLGSSYTTEFEVGKKSLLDVLDARNESFLAMGALITTDATYDLAALRLLAAAGELTQFLKINDNVEGEREQSDVPHEIPENHQVLETDIESSMPEPQMKQVPAPKITPIKRGDASKTKIVW